MASVPAALRKADIARFAQRAGQLEKAKPVVAYWCNYWILAQILGKSLQDENEECMAYSAKAELSENDAISDDLASQAYIEQFGLETFERADKAMNANKSSRQTADTFSAAATFFDLRQIWGPLEAETVSKSKYAKYHALRIAKALKAGEDPNLSNPTPEPSANDEDHVLSPTDPDVQMLDGQQNSAQYPPKPGQPFVEEVPDEDGRTQRINAHSSATDQFLQPSKANSSQRPVDGEGERHASGMPSPPGPGEDYYHNPPAGDVSPMLSPSAARTGSEGDGYFPSVPDLNTRAPVPSSPQPPSEVLQTDTSLQHSPPPTSYSQPHPAKSSLHSFPPPPIDLASVHAQAPPPGSDQNRQHYQPSSQWRASVQPSPILPFSPLAQTPTAAPASESAEKLAQIEREELIAGKVRKHMRNADECLKYSDFKGAEKMLKEALWALNG